jgi:hypothetical protein
MADEINRASPRTQSALLQAMQEGFVTIAGQRHDLPRSLTLTAAEPALIDMTDGSLIAFELSLTDASRSATVFFDGLNVSTSSGAARS